MVSIFDEKLIRLVAGHDALEYGVAFLANIRYSGRGVVADKGWRQGERIDVERDALDFKLVGDDLHYQFLFEFADLQKFGPDPSIVESIERSASERKVILVRQLDLKAKLVANIDIFFPAGETSADADLFEAGFLPLAEFCINYGRKIK
jgi:hypothetical protein